MMTSSVLLLLLVACLRAYAVDLTVEGLCPAVYTPFDEDGKLNVEAIPAYARYLTNHNIRGVLICGTSGEGPALSTAERKRLLDAWIREGKRFDIKVVIQVGGQPLPEVLELAQYAEKAGAAAIMTLPELFYKPANDSAVVRYLGIVSNAAPKLPILYYDHPDLSGTTINPAKFFREAKAKVPNFKGMKCNLITALAITATEKLQDDQQLFMMSHATWSANLMMGLNSSMAGLVNLYPGLFLGIQDAVNSNNIVRARELQSELNARMAAITAIGDYVPAGKAAMEVISGIRMGNTRDPLNRFSIKQFRAIEEALRNIDAKYAKPPTKVIVEPTPEE